ncbi:MAG TPA: hypothetical protein VFT27_05760 [Actinomycetota bacterium]|nr:hypothetical protein [Actinomycetota bacterium]
MIAASAYMLVFRILHIAAGVAWAGSVFLFVVLVQPSAAAIGPAAGPFMMELLGKRKLVSWLLSLAGTTIVAGLFMYWHDANGFDGLGDFASSRYGLALTIGALAAITAFLFGLFGTRPNVARLLELAGRAAASEGPPPPEIGREIAGVQARLKTLARISFAFIVVAVLAMSTARYW